jgi:hypothetical protein
MVVEGGGVNLRTPRFEEAVLNMFPGSPSTRRRRDGQAMHSCKTAVLRGAQ